MDSSRYVSGRVWAPVQQPYRNLTAEDVWGPTGPVHAILEGHTVAACGQDEVTPTGDPWPPSGQRAGAPECLRCRRRLRA